ncbi:hypothetical protein E2C01_070209 [Portunus trituberculatus]|uniref:Uncharacterized protein n=1 Tax=Portunus trituberculatus TaxID=210409 RepID=A0A5B7HS32_PORTR|nr:hypothetical protein [Portunus trituberculatus]
MPMTLAVSSGRVGGGPPPVFRTARYWIERATNSILGPPWGPRIREGCGVVLYYSNPRDGDGEGAD